MGLLNARRRFMGHHKPYDAEVEYIESSADEWTYIDTGYVPTGLDNEWSFEFMPIKHYAVAGTQLTFIHIISAWDGDSNHGCYRIMSEGTDFSYLYVYNGTKPGINATRTGFKSIKYNTRYSFEVYNNHVTLLPNGTTVTYTPAYDGNTDSLKIFGYQHYEKWMHGRLYHLKWWKAGELVLDLIPVRKGHSAYLYDRVSRRLLEPTKGKLIAGPDVK